MKNSLDMVSGKLETAKENFGEPQKRRGEEK